MAEHLDLEQDILQHVSQLNSLHLATIQANGLPDISYTPFVYQDGCFFILISELAGHFTNLTAHAQCATSIIADESATKNPFARTRLLLQCDSEFLQRDSSIANAVLSKMRKRLGETVDLLASLNDFHLCQLTVREGRFVTGFAKAYHFEAFNIQQCQHLNPTSR